MNLLTYEGPAAAGSVMTTRSSTGRHEVTQAYNPMSLRKRWMMNRQRLAVTLSALSFVVVGSACNSNPAETRTDDAAVSTERAADAQQERNDEISGLDRRIADIEREYTEKSAKIATGAREATAGLKEELKEDVANVRQAVADLRSTTPDNWWERHEQAIARTADDVEADVRRLAGKLAPVPAATGTTGEGVSTAPFTSRRDAFVARLQARIDAMEDALGKVDASGARETEIEDTRARVEKLREDIGRLRTAEADDWWDVTRTRVTEYLDRVEASVNRLDNDKPKSE